jgi:flagellar protein FliO/FliZ
MEDQLINYFRYIFGFLLVVGLIGLCAIFAKRYLFGGAIQTRLGKERRVRIVELLPIDAKRRVILLQKDREEYLILTGGGSDLLIDKSSLPPS